MQMIQGDNDENVNVVQRLQQEKFAGKLGLTLLPKLKAKDLSPITGELLKRYATVHYILYLEIN